MFKLLNSNLPVIVHAGFVYLPLHFDADIAEETDRIHWQGDGILRPEEEYEVIRKEGAIFIKSLSLQSLLNGCELLDDESWSRLGEDRGTSHSILARLRRTQEDETFAVILLEIMPHFVRKGGGLKNRPHGLEGFLNTLTRKVSIPKEYHDFAEELLEGRFQRSETTDSGDGGIKLSLPTDRVITAAELKRWLFDTLPCKLSNKKRDWIERMLALCRQKGLTKANHIALFLYLAEQDAFEINGCGFFRLRGRTEYIVFKRTGEYVLTDYYGRYYLFPDCRVGVSSLGVVRPFVIDKYKHPFLGAHAAWQLICMRNESHARDEIFCAESAIAALQAGVNALLHGYDARRRNGYHSLDRTTHYYRPVDFDDYRIPKDHPKISSGNVVIKDDFG